MDSILSTQEEASHLRNMITELNRKYDELDFKRSTYDKSLKEFSKDASFLVKSQDTVHEVVNKFKQMDSLVIDLETRTSSIMKLREWLVKAETHLENLNYETDKRIKTLETLKELENQEEKNETKNQDQKKVMVKQLNSQGWSIDEIAKTAGLSIGEVEFILDLNFNTIKK